MASEGALRNIVGAGMEGREEKDRQFKGNTMAPLFLLSSRHATWWCQAHSEQGLRKHSQKVLPVLH